MSLKYHWFGALLIVAGLTLLLDRLGVFTLGWHGVFWALVMVVGAFKIVRGFSVKPSGGGARFWGTELFLVGLYFLLNQTDLLDFPHFLLPSFICLAVGIGLILVFAGNHRDWHVLIPAAIFCGFGILIMLVYSDKSDQLFRSYPTVYRSEATMVLLS